ncbi:MAG: hypothetical protein LBG58_05330 [Planctomycetaceae bacterium]|nr:hypothetical protein [Planctomycetaceae bacterium]
MVSNCPPSGFYSYGDADLTVAGASPLPKIRVLTATRLPTQLFRQRGRYRKFVIYQ